MPKPFRCIVFPTAIIPLLAFLVLANCSPTDSTTATERKIDAEQSEPYSIVAKVHDTDITREALDAEIEKHSKRRPPSHPALDAAQQKEFEWNVLDDMVTRKLIDKAASDLSQEDIHKKAETMISDFRARFQDEAQFQANLEGNGLTVEEFNNEAYFRSKFLTLIETANSESLEVTEQQAEIFYAENKQRFLKPEMVSARHILIKNTPDATDEARASSKKKIEAARSRITQGEDFAKVAAEVSEDPGSKEKGGELGTFPKGRMVPEFEELAFTLDVGKLSHVFETNFGYHFLEVTGKTKPETIPFAQVKQQIIGSLTQEKRRNASQTLITSLRESGNHEIFLPHPSMYSTEDETAETP
ncbi:MAG: peptidylprolyl isomerase [Verrucomicrobiota bacterium]